MQCQQMQAHLKQLGGVGCAVDADAHGQPGLVLESSWEAADCQPLADDVDVRATCLLWKTRECRSSDERLWVSWQTIKD